MDDRAMLEPARLEGLFVNVADFPRKGFNFPDITPILERSPKTFRAIIASLGRAFRGSPIDSVACIESFGYVFGVPIALQLGACIICVRRPGKLPRATVSKRYRMCYSDDREMAIHSDSVRTGDRVLIVDDFLASGGTFIATVDMIERCGGTVVGGAFVCELVEMRARQRSEVNRIPLHTLLKMRFNPERAAWVILNGSHADAP